MMCKQPMARLEHGYVGGREVNCLSVSSIIECKQKLKTRSGRVFLFKHMLQMNAALYFPVLLRVSQIFYFTEQSHWQNFQCLDTLPRDSRDIAANLWNNDMVNPTDLGPSLCSLDIA